jgi:hypothetical protein
MDPIPVGIKTYIPSDLFAGKMHALLCRLWNERIKGRDWYDFVWYVRKKVSLNLDHLQERMQQTKHLGKDQILTKDILNKMLHDKISKLDIEKASQDISPFLSDEAQIASWSHDYFHQFANQIIFLHR